MTPHDDLTDGLVPYPLFEEVGVVLEATAAAIAVIVGVIAVCNPPDAVVAVVGFVITIGAGLLLIDAVTRGPFGVASAPYSLTLTGRLRSMIGALAFSTQHLRHRDALRYAQRVYLEPSVREPRTSRLEVRAMCFECHSGHIWSAVTRTS